MFWVEEDVKPMILNATNAQSLAEIVGRDDTAAAKGQRVEVYVDPNVRFGTQKVGGLRLRAPRPAATGSGSITGMAADGDDEFDEDLPF